MSGPQVTLTLGLVEFDNLEIPSNIPWGTTQSLVTHRLVGGTRIINAMGPDWKPLTWSGLLFGSDAASRARTLEQLAADGLPRNLTWGPFSYLVVVKEFSADFKRLYEMPYSITCEVVSDNSRPITSTVGATVDESVNSDAVTAQNLVKQLVAEVAYTKQAAAAVSLQNRIEDIVSGLSAIGSLLAASPDAVSVLLGTVTAAQVVTSSLLVSADAAVGSTPGFAGVVAGANPQDMIASLQATSAAMNQASGYIQIGSVLGRIAANLASINGSPNILAVAGGNLFDIAAETYGDPTTWTAIANANQSLNGDPFIQGTALLTIPLQANSSNGILSK